MAATRGRPRATGPSPLGLSTREEILHAAAALFCTDGYGSTSTHKIARAARMSQATMYHYFSGKHEILLDLLMQTVGPSVDAAARLAAGDGSPGERLWHLCRLDVELLLSGEQNLGQLYLLPELSDERFAPFHAARTDLYRTYRRLVSEATGVDEAAAHADASLVFGLVESVILRRRTEPRLGPETAAQIADGALRAIGLDPAAVAGADRNISVG